MDDKTLGANLRRLREAAGLSQGQLAARAAEAGWDGVYPQTILKIEKGTRSLKLTETEAVASALDMTTAEIVDALTSLNAKAAIRTSELALVRKLYLQARHHQHEAAVTHLPKMLESWRALRMLLEVVDVDPKGDPYGVHRYADQTMDELFEQVRQVAESR